MMIIRPVRLDDLDDLYGLATGAGAGLTTFPADRDALERRIHRSLDSFAAEVEVPGGEYYLLVLEDPDASRVIGTSAIFAAVGLDRPFYNYRILKLSQASADPEMKVDTELLVLANDYAGASELATLYLSPDYRGTVMGRQLSRARYLLIAAHRERFAETVMAELRGWVDENDASPFWEAVARPFFQMDLMEADRINSLGNHQFIADLMPKYPIYINLLTDIARDVIGKPHPKSAAALKILTNEGFRFRGSVDIFDAGPCVEVRRDQIASVRAATTAVVGGIAEVDGATEYLIANPALGNFRVALGPLVSDGATATISPAMADALKVGQGEELIFTPAVLDRK